MTGDAYRQPRVAGEGVTGKGDEAPPDSKTPARGFPRRRDGPEPLAAAQSIFGSVSNWWYGGGLGSVHSSVRSAERRVGKECVSTCRSRLSQCHLKKKKKKYEQTK